MPLPTDPIRSRPGFRPVRTGRAADPAVAGRECDSRDLLAGAREILIRHGGELYRLRHTRNDKLILTK